jgi:hypothetical protein
MEEKKPTVSDLGKEGFKMNYSKIKRAVMQCELDKQSLECKRQLKDIGLEWHE